jgi:hypothetical protein
MLSRFGSLLIVLCLFAAPLCATRCALSFCALPDTHQQSSSGCHHQSKHSNGSSMFAGAMAPTCIPAASFLTTPPVQQSRLLSVDADSHLLAAALISEPTPTISALIAFRIFNRGSSLDDSPSSLANPPLRL